MRRHYPPWSPRIERQFILPEPNPRKPDFLPALILLAIVGLFCAVIWLFPYMQAIIEHRNCVAIGRTDCDIIR